MVAHELAHAKHRDVLVGTALGALGTAFGVGLLGVLLTSRALRRRAGVAGIGDAAVVPLLLLLIGVGSLVSAP
ncbi:MAG TPA: M48 family metalloprotease, partial [Candidatus Limnocylindria bacterium]|nr:M48 family metalloprotease [Candidatus Limnocylindria bacterium]